MMPFPWEDRALRVPGWAMRFGRMTVERVRMCVAFAAAPVRAGPGFFETRVIEYQNGGALAWD
jgi:hypothetical protein